MRLKRLRTNLDPPLQILVDRLDHVGVKSTDQVVHTPTNRLFGLLRKSSSTVDSTIETPSTTTVEVEQVDERQEVKKKDLERLLEICLELEMGGRPSSAQELLVVPIEGDEETSPPSPTLGFGLESLDDLLQGLFSHPVGWPSGILEIAGTKSSGRTVSICSILQSPSRRWSSSALMFIPSTLTFIFPSDTSPPIPFQNPRLTTLIHTNPPPGPVHSS